MESQTNTNKPGTIGLAVKLLWVSLAVGLVRILLDFAHLSALGKAAFTGFVLVFTLALMAWLIYKISAGKNWARITYLVLFLLGFLPTLPVMLTEFSRSPLVAILTVVQVGLQVYALFLLFTKPVGAWFRKVDAA